MLYWKARGHIGSYAGLQVVSILGLVFLYGVPTLQRATLAHVGCVEIHRPPHQKTTFHRSPEMFRGCSRFTYWTRKTHLVRLCPDNRTVIPCTWQMTQDLYADVASLTASSGRLQMFYKHLRLTWRLMRSLVCPHTHWEHHRVIM